MLQRLHSELDCLRDKPSPVEELEVILERFQHSSPVLLPNILTNSEDFPIVNTCLNFQDALQERSFRMQDLIVSGFYVFIIGVGLHFDIKMLLFLIKRSLTGKSHIKVSLFMTAMARKNCRKKPL